MFNQKLKDVKLYKEDNTYFLDVTYETETDAYVSVINIPRVLLPLSNTCNIISDYSEEVVKGIRNPKVSLGLSLDIELPIYRKCVFNEYYTEKIIKEKTKEMTLAEIEKKLGHKVKLISEESKK